MRPIIKEPDNTSQSTVAIIGFVFVFLLIFALIFVNNKFPIVSENNYTVLMEISGDNILTNNLTILCVSGYSATVRDVSESLKQEVYERDNITKSSKTAIDHIIPLCLGGSNDIKNLSLEWVQNTFNIDIQTKYHFNQEYVESSND